MWSNYVQEDHISYGAYVVWSSQRCIACSSHDRHMIVTCTSHAYHMHSHHTTYTTHTWTRALIHSIVHAHITYMLAVSEWSWMMSQIPCMLRSVFKHSHDSSHPWGWVTLAVGDKPVQSFRSLEEVFLIKHTSKLATYRIAQEVWLQHLSNNATVSQHHHFFVYVFFSGVKYAKVCKRIQPSVMASFGNSSMPEGPIDALGDME